MIVTPHVKLPVSGFSFPARISNKAVIALGSRDRKAILSPFSTVNSTSRNKVCPSIDLLKLRTSKIRSPTSRSGVKIIPGYFRVEGKISSTFNFSNIFLRLVVCFDFATLALKREINSCNSFFFSSAFLFLA